MKATTALLMLLVSMGMAASVEIGSSETPSNMPFCAD